MLAVGRDAAVAFRCDVSKKDEVDAAIASGPQAPAGRINILVNNAGIAQIKDFLDISPAGMAADD